MYFLVKRVVVEKVKNQLPALALLFLLFGLLVLGAPHLSLTADEPAHIAGGYALWARRAQALPVLAQRGYPPLLCALEGLLAYTAAPHIPLEELAGWPDNYDAFSLALLPQLGSPARTAMVARFPILSLTVLLAAVVWRWAGQVGGRGAGLLALAVAVLDPTLLAHGRLATTDAGVVALGTAALYVTWRLTRIPSWSRALWMGGLLGLTMLAKVSGPLWLAAAGVMVLAAAIRRRGERRTRFILQGLSGAVLALLVWWAAYGLSWGRVPGLAIPVPAPAHWAGSLYLTGYSSPVFAFGERGAGRWWWYYPLCFLIKNPLPLLIGLGISVVVLFYRPRNRRHLLLFVFFPLLYALAAVVQGMNIGYRHILPIHPFFYLGIGVTLGQPAIRWRKRAWVRGALILLGVWYAAGTLRLFPHEIAYFNELVGGPEQGYRYLVDSNLDWGQSVAAQQDYVTAHPGVQDEPPAARFHPAGGRYIVSASYLQGVGTGDPYAYEWFRHQEPQAVLDYSYLIYEVPDDDVAWVAQCDRPGPPLNRETMSAGIEPHDVRSITFDCTQTWVYPGGGGETGIYVLHQDLLREPRRCLPTLLPCPRAAAAPFVAQGLAGARLSYEQAADPESPAFVLYERSAAGAGPSSEVDLSPFSSSTAPDKRLVPPLALDGPLAFMGATVSIEKSLEIQTWWRVTAGPIERPFSIMVQTLTKDGQVSGQFDGLGISPLALLPGDVIVQRHLFPDLGTAPASFLTGAYWLDTMERWPIVDMPETDAIQVTP